jgi:hypothetical protein
VHIHARLQGELPSCELHLGAADALMRIFLDVEPELARQPLHLVIFRQDLGADAREFFIPRDLD